MSKRNKLLTYFERIYKITPHEMYNNACIWHPGFVPFGSERNTGFGHDNMQHMNLTNS